MSDADASAAPLAVAVAAAAAPAAPACSTKALLQEEAPTEQHRALSSTEDLVAQLGAGDSSVKSVAAATASEAAAATSDAAPPSTQQQQQQQQQPLRLAPEEEAAVAECVQQFVGLYEQAFLSRAVQLVADFTRAHASIPEAAVAQALRGRGVSLQQLQARAAEVQRGIAECASDEGWRLIQDGALRLMYRHSPGSTVHCFKGSCVLPAPMEQPLAMAREFDLVKTWNSYMTHSRVLKTFSDVDLLVYASVWLPWPFAERDVLISAVADDHLKDHGVVAASFASPPETPADVELPAGADQRVRLFFTSGSCMVLTPLPAPEAVTVQGGAVKQDSSGRGQHTKVTVVSNIESGQHVPEAVISFVLRVFAPFMYSQVLSVLHKSFDNPDDPLPQRLAQHHELYDSMRQRCQDYLDGHPQ